MGELAEIAESWLGAMNEHSLEGMNKLCWDNAVGDEVAEPQVAEGIEEIARSYRELFHAFPDCQSEILNVIDGGNQVLAEVRWTGTNENDFRGAPATGKFVDIRIAYIFRIEGGKIRRITEYYDGATVAQQMGL
jgi:steroid delta-isomerase-like uncharacterized protein